MTNHHLNQHNNRDPRRSLCNAVIPLVFTLALVGCVAPQSEFSALQPAQAESNRSYTEQIEAVGRAQEREERMNRAEAAEVASRNAPKNVSTTTVFAPRF